VIVERDSSWAETTRQLAALFPHSTY
jgi:hypothetical protein